MSSGAATNAVQFTINVVSPATVPDGWSEIDRNDQWVVWQHNDGAHYVLGVQDKPANTLPKRVDGTIKNNRLMLGEHGFRFSRDGGKTWPELDVSSDYKPRNSVPTPPVAVPSELRQELLRKYPWIETFVQGDTVLKIVMNRSQCVGMALDSKWYPLGNLFSSLESGVDQWQREISEVKHGSGQPGVTGEVFAEPGIDLSVGGEVAITPIPSVPDWVSEFWQKAPPDVVRILVSNDSGQVQKSDGLYYPAAMLGVLHAGRKLTSGQTTASAVKDAISQIKESRSSGRKEPWPADPGTAEIYERGPQEVAVETVAVPDAEPEWVAEFFKLAPANIVKLYQGNGHAEAEDDKGLFYAAGGVDRRPASAASIVSGRGGSATRLVPERHRAGQNVYLRPGFQETSLPPAPPETQPDERAKALARLPWIPAMFENCPRVESIGVSNVKQYIFATNKHQKKVGTEFGADIGVNKEWHRINNWIAGSDHYTGDSFPSLSKNVVMFRREEFVKPPVIPSNLNWYEALLFVSRGGKPKEEE